MLDFHFVVLLRCDHMRPHVLFVSVLWSHIEDHASAAALHTTIQIYIYFVLILDIHFVVLHATIRYNHIRPRAIC